MPAAFPVGQSPSRALTAPVAPCPQIQYCHSRMAVATGSTGFILCSSTDSHFEMDVEEGCSECRCYKDCRRKNRVFLSPHLQPGQPQIEVQQNVGQEFSCLNGKFRRPPKSPHAPLLRLNSECRPPPRCCFCCQRFSTRTHFLVPTVCCFPTHKCACSSSTPGCLGCHTGGPSPRFGYATPPPPPPSLPSGPT